MKYSNEELADFKKFKNCYAKMAWYLLECEIIYYSNASFPNSVSYHRSWEKIRSISDIEYDQKRQTLKNLANALGEKLPEHVSIQLKRPSVKMVLDKMQLEPSNEIKWPTEADQMKFTIFMLAQCLKASYLKNINAYTKKVSGF